MSKQIVVIKNTFYMFFRMFFVMFLTIISTRLLLKTLGFEGYGVYDLIFGVVILFNILSGTMATTLQRFYNVSHDDKYKKSCIYTASLQIFSVISLIVCFVGFWVAQIVIQNLNIPIDKINEATTFFNLCVLNLVFMIFRLPFIALLISSEKMGIYASISIIDAVFKFLGVLLLSYLSLNLSNLVLYGYILSVITFIVTCIYVAWCYKRLEMPRIQKKINKAYYKEIFSFSGWTIFGSSSALFSQQGLSILLNKFFGVLINAANAVAQQVYAAVYQFVNSFQTAYSPYLMKTYAENDFDKLRKLIVFFSKFSAFLYLLIAIPLFTFTESILKVWLGDIPNYAVLFTRLTLVIVFFEVLSAPLWLTIQASGEIKRYQIIISIILLLNLPIAYLCFIEWQQPIFAFVAKIITALFAYIYRIYSVRSIKCLELREYGFGLIFRLFILLLIISPAIFFYMSQKYSNLFEIFLNVFVLIFLLLVIASLVLLTKMEYKKVYDIVLSFFRKV